MQSAQLMHYFIIIHKSRLIRNVIYSTYIILADRLSKVNSVDLPAAKGFQRLGCCNTRLFESEPDERASI